MNLTISDAGFITPTHNKDLPLFKHCANGMYAVTRHLFDTEVEELLMLHKVSEIHFTKED